MKHCYLILIWDIAGATVSDGPFETREIALSAAMDIRREMEAEHIAILGPIDYEEV